MPVPLGRFMECSSWLPTTQFAYINCLGPYCSQFIREWEIGGNCSDLLSPTLFGSTIKEVSINFAALWVLEDLNFLYIAITFLSRYITVDGCRSKLVNDVSGVPRGHVLGLL